MNNSTRTDWSLTFVRRCFALSSIVLCAYNTLTSIQTAVDMMAVTRPYPHNLMIGPDMEIRIYDYDTSSDMLDEVYFSCDNKNRQEVNPHALVTCPITLANNPPYAIFLFLWVAYFICLFVYHLYHTFQYEVTDLRYYINMLNAENNKYHKVYILLGMILTFISFVYAAFRSVNSHSAPVVDALKAQFLFLVLNIFLLKQFLIEGTHSVATVVMETDFPNPIMLHNVPYTEHCSLFNLYGRVISVELLFEYLLRNVAVRRLNGCDADAGQSDKEIHRALHLLFGARCEWEALRDASDETTDPDLKAELLPQMHVTSVADDPSL